MNFVGHAATARWHSDEALFALGAMLPDFATMCQARVPSPADPTLDAGVSHHHRVDAAFHRLPAFLDLYRRGTEDLRRAGATRGPARGAAHIAVELFLDGELVRDGAIADHYMEALELAAPADGRIELDGWDRVHPRLMSRGVPHAYRDPETVADIVLFILGRRPLLVPGPDDARAIRERLPALRERVVDASRGIMHALETRLT